MTGPAQVAVNNRALIAAAAKLEKAGYDGDCYRFVESLIVSVLADGYRQLDPPVPPRGPGASREAREAAMQATADAIATARHRRTGVTA